MLEVLAIILIIIFSPVILIAGFISLAIILGIIYVIFSVPINLAKQVRKCKEEDQENTQNLK